MKFVGLLFLSLLHSRCFAAATVTQVQLRLTISQVALDLGKVLSKNAGIVLPDDPTWNSAIARAPFPRISPGYQAVVEVATEDVAGTVCS